MQRFLARVVDGGWWKVGLDVGGAVDTPIRNSKQGKNGERDVVE